MEKRLSMPPSKPHATSQPLRLSHTHRSRPSTHSPHNQHSQHSALICAYVQVVRVGLMYMCTGMIVCLLK